MHGTGKVAEAYWAQCRGESRSAGRAALVEHRRVCSSPTKARPDCWWHPSVLYLGEIARRQSRTRVKAHAPPPSCSPAMRPGGSRRTSSSLAGCCVSRSNPDELVSRLNVLQSRLKIFKGRRGAAPSFLRSTVPCKPLRRVVPVGSAHHPRHHGYDRHASGAVAASGQLIRGRDHMTFVERRPPADRCPARGKSSALVAWIKGQIRCFAS